MKKCNVCDIEKSFNCFSKRIASRDGLSRLCKDCARTLNKKYRKENKSKLSEKAKRYYEEHAIERSLYYKNWCINNKEQEKQRTAEYRRLHLEENKQYFKNYTLKNREKISKRAYEKYHNDVEYRLKSRLRTRLNCAIRSEQKAGSTVKDLGCSIDFLKFWLELQFYDNPKTGEKMTWDNWSLAGWHIDHKMPISSFDLSDKEQFLKACHFTNLQPLWAFENLSKGNKT